ncbi:MAG: hypothetical protein K0B02_05325 [DPANN group archaeon]|nr:hypothetical protein [DPANN group archaeon]
MFLDESDIKFFLNRKNYYSDIDHIFRLIDIILNIENNIFQLKKEINRDVKSNSLKYDYDYVKLLDGCKTIALKGDLPLIFPIQMELRESFEHNIDLSSDRISDMLGLVDDPVLSYLNVKSSKTVNLFYKKYQELESFKPVIDKYHRFNYVYVDCLGKILKKDLSENERKSISLERDTISCMNNISIFAYGFYNEMLFNLFLYNGIMAGIDGVEICRTFAYEFNSLDILKSSASLVSSVNDTRDNIVLEGLYDHIPEYVRHAVSDDDSYNKIMSILD